MPICKFYQSTGCLKGEHCPYGHTDPQENVIESCWHFRMGTCRFGTDCLKSHDLDMLQPQSKSVESSGPQTPTEIAVSFGPSAIQNVSSSSTAGDPDPTDSSKTDMPPPGLTESIHAPKVSAASSPVFESTAEPTEMILPEPEVDPQPSSSDLNADAPVFTPSVATEPTFAESNLAEGAENDWPSMTKPEDQLPEASQAAWPTPTSPSPQLVRQTSFLSPPPLPPNDVRNGWSNWNTPSSHQPDVTSFDHNYHAQLLYSKLPLCPYFYHTGMCPLFYTCSFRHERGSDTGDNRSNNESRGHNPIHVPTMPPQPNVYPPQIFPMQPMMFPAAVPSMAYANFQNAQVSNAQTFFQGNSQSNTDDHSLPASLQSSNTLQQLSYAYEQPTASQEPVWGENMNGESLSDVRADDGLGGSPDFDSPSIETPLEAEQDGLIEDAPAASGWGAEDSGGEWGVILDNWGDDEVQTESKEPPSSTWDNTLVDSPSSPALQSSVAVKLPTTGLSKDHTAAMNPPKSPSEKLDPGSRRDSISSSTSSSRISGRKIAGHYANDRWARMPDGSEGGSSSPDSANGQTIDKRQPICNFYATNGGCRYGADCRFRHEELPSSKIFTRTSSPLARGKKRRANLAF